MKRTQCFYFNKKQTLMCLYYSLSDSDEIYVNHYTTIFAIECCNAKKIIYSFESAIPPSPVKEKSISFRVS